MDEESKAFYIEEKLNRNKIAMLLRDQGARTIIPQWYLKVSAVMIVDCLTLFLFSIVEHKTICRFERLRETIRDNHCRGLFLTKFSISSMVMTRMATIPKEFV